MKRRKDARNVEALFAYDSLNRMTSKTYVIPAGVNPAVGATPNVTYCYDGQVYAGGVCGAPGTAIPYAKGRLTSAGSAASVTSYLQYDALGRVLKSRQETGATPYEFEY